MTYKVYFFWVTVLILQWGAALAQSPPPEADYHYTGSLEINPDTGYIKADWRITVYDSEATEISFLLRDTLGEINISGPGVRSATTERQSGFQDFWALQIDLASPSEQRIVQIAYAGVLLPEPMENRINSITPERVELNVDSFWFPIDAGFAKTLTVDLFVKIGTGWQAVTTGEAVVADAGIKLNNTDPRLDITFMLARDFHMTTAQGFEIYDVRDRFEGTDKLVATAQRCRNFLNERFGVQDPLPVSKLLITGRPSSGYARENYIVFTDIAETEPAPLMRFVCHEFAHYWSGGAKFDTVDNWLNEAFAEYLGTMAVREYLGLPAYQQMLVAFAAQIADQDLPHIWKQGDTARGPYAVQYRKAPLVLAKLEERIGAEQFLEFIQAWFVSSEKSTETLLKVLEQVAGLEQKNAFEQALAE